MGGKAILLLLAVVGVLVGVLALTDREAPTEERVETAALEGRSLGRATRQRVPVAVGPPSSFSCFPLQTKPSST